MPILQQILQQRHQTRVSDVWSTTKMKLCHNLCIKRDYPTKIYYSGDISYTNHYWCVGCAHAVPKDDAIHNKNGSLLCPCCYKRLRIKSLRGHMYVRAHLEKGNPKQLGDSWFICQEIVEFYRQNG